MIQCLEESIPDRRRAWIPIAAWARRNDRWLSMSTYRSLVHARVGTAGGISGLRCERKQSVIVNYPGAR